MCIIVAEVVLILISNTSKLLTRKVSLIYHCCNQWIYSVVTLVRLKSNMADCLHMLWSIQTSSRLFIITIIVKF